MAGKEEKEKPEAPVFIPSMADYPLATLWKMHPDRFRPLLDAFHKKAVMDPTEANVYDYLVMQDIARRRSAGMANVTGYVLQKHPELDPGKDMPLAAPGRAARVRMQRGEISRTILAGRADHALLYFSRKSCPYCAVQKNILAFFRDRYGWPVKEIDIEASPDLAARFDIRTTPTLLLIGRNRGEFIPVAAGVVSLDSLEQRLYRGVRLLAGEITPEEYSTYDFEKGGAYDPAAILEHNPYPGREEK